MADLFREDYHNHTCFSPDTAGNLPTQDIDAAISKGLDAIMFTDHCECNTHTGTSPNPKPWPDFDHVHYFEHIESLKNKYDIKIGVGFELGQPLQGKEYAEMIVDSHDWDVILASEHNVWNHSDFCLIDYHGLDTDKICKQYFEELYDIAVWGRFDVMAHLYYFVKYIVNQGLDDIDFTRYDYEISKIYKILIENGKALEVNTSAMNNERYKRSIPGLHHIKLFKELGGEFVTIGSDSHSFRNIGNCVDEANELLLEAGFKYITTYEKRKPILNPIIKR